MRSARDETHVINAGMMDQKPEAEDPRTLLLALGYLVKEITKRHPSFQPNEIRDRANSAARILMEEISFDGCEVMQDNEVRDLLCRLSGLCSDLGPIMQRLENTNGADMMRILARHTGVFCGRGGGGEKKGYRVQPSLKTNFSPPAPKPPGR